MTILLPKLDFLYANSVFAVQNEGTYLRGIMRKTCTLRTKITTLGQKRLMKLKWHFHDEQFVPAALHSLLYNSEIESRNIIITDSVVNPKKRN